MNTHITLRGLGLSVAVLLSSHLGFSQISGAVTVGTGGTYPSLTGAGGLFAAINSGGLSGNVTASIIDDLTETGANNLAQWTETPAASNFTLKIVPASGTEKLISGSSSAGFIILFGADRVYVDGSFNGSGRYLRFRNTGTGSSSSTISLLSDAQNDTIANCIIEGASITTSTTTSGAVIYMSTGTSSGNDNNAFTGNVIKDISGAANVPDYLIKLNNSATAALSSDNNFIYNNEFANYNTCGIYLGNSSGTTASGGSNWTIRKNAFYQTANRTTALSAIKINVGNNHVVDSNNIGGSAADRSGAPLTSSGATIYGIQITSTNATAATPVIISANNIGNIAGNSATTATYGISSLTYATITNNTIGRNTLASDTIGNLGTSNYGIYFAPASSSVTGTITGNKIRNLRTQAGTNNMSAGIFLQGIPFVDNNIIDSITSNTGALALGSNALCGINLSGIIQTGTLISNNSISNLILTNPTAAACAGGIIYQNTVSGRSKIIRNKINSIVTTGTGAGIIAGIAENSVTGIDTITNNVINLGNGITNSNIRALYDLTPSGGSSNHVYLNNTVVLSGTQSGTGNAAAYFRSATTNNVVLRNNLLLNQRTVGGTGFNYAIINSATTTTSSWKGDYNLLYNLDSTKLANTVAGTYSFATYKAQALSDTNSVCANVAFTNVANNDLHIDGTNAAAWNVFGRGMAMAGVTNDFDGTPRSIIAGTPTTIGAYETSMPSVLPPDMDMTGAITPSGTTTFSSAGRKIATITWGANVPTAFTTAKYYPGVPAPSPSTTGPNLNSYFELVVTPDVSTYDYTIKTYYTPAEANGIADAAMTGIKKHGANPYIPTDAGATSTVSGDGRSIQSNTLADFSIFSMSGNTSPLAIHLQTIAAKNIGANNSIDWSTATETASDYFELERSTDGRNFSKIATIRAKGKASTYNYIDANTASGVNYYRLKMTLDNNAFAYSKVVTAEVKTHANVELNAYPNPVQNKVTFTLNGAVQNNATLTVTDANGRTLNTYKVSNHQMEIDMNHFATGTYFIKYSDDQQIKTLKMIKQ